MNVAGLAGCYRQSRNHRTGTVTEIFIASEQDLDVFGAKYATVCRDHGTLCGAETLAKARVLAVWPDEFCEDCMKLT